LLATVVFGGIFFVRSFGRADEPHLDSAIPPVCLLLGYAAYLAYRRWASDLPGAQTAIVVVGFALWGVLLGVDTMYQYPFSVLPPDDNPRITWSQQKRVDKIVAWSEPGERYLDLTAFPMLHVASDRLGYGYRDILMPGTFVSRDEELRFLRLLEAAPPPLVLWPLRVFDQMPERSIRRFAPQVVKWVLARYEMRAFDDEVAILLPIRPGVDPEPEDLTGKGRSMQMAPRKPAAQRR
jgi:hypothetical protein